MKKNRINIEGLERKKPFEVPEGYFDQLPMKIQERIAEEGKTAETVWSPGLRVALQWATAILIFATTAYFLVFRPGSDPQDAEALLAQVETEELVAYLQYSDISTEEIIANVDWQDTEIEFENTDADLLNDLDLEGQELMEIMEYDLDSEIL